MGILLLEQSIPWFGKHAGFRLLQDNLIRNGCNARSVYATSGLIPRIIGKAYSSWMRLPARNQNLAAAEFEFLMRMRFSGNGGHVLFLESHLPLLRVNHSQEKWVGTIHLPRRSWKANHLEPLRSAERLLVLCDQFVEEFSEFVPASQ